MGIKMEFVYLVRDRLIQNKGVSFSNTEMKLKCQKYCKNSKGDDVFLGCVVFIWTMCILNACPVKAKNNYLTNTPKSENTVSI